MMRRPGNHQWGEEGATLLLALIFVLLVSVIMLAIVNLSGTNILNTTNLQNERTLEYSAEGGVQASIQAVRYLTPTATTTYCSHTPAYQPPAPINGAVVYCQVGTPVYARSLTFEACLPTTTVTACVNNLNSADILRASVFFNDISAGCSGPIGTGCYNPIGPVAGSTSGTSVTVERWIVERANG
jgi:Tfp pilus assembly protein PilV